MWQLALAFLGGDMEGNIMPCSKRDEEDGENMYDEDDEHMGKMRKMGSEQWEKKDRKFGAFCL
jgi:hypothetical protein